MAPKVPRWGLAAIRPGVPRHGLQTASSIPSLFYFPLSELISKKAPVLSKSHDSSTHPVTRNSPIVLQLQLWTLLVPFHSCQPWKVPVLVSIARHQSPAHELLLLAQQYSSPESAQDPQRLGRVGPPDPPPTVPRAQLGGPGHRAVPSGLGRPTQMASPFSGPRRRPPCLRKQPATSLQRLFQQGPCPRPPAPRRPSPRPNAAVSSSLPPRPAAPPPPWAPRCHPSWGRSAPGAPAPSSRAPRPRPLPWHPPAPLSSGDSAAARPPTPRRARSGLAPCAWRATLERHDHRAPIARPRSSRRTPRRAARRRRREGVGATRACQEG